METESELRRCAESLKRVSQEILKELASPTRKRGHGEMVRNLNSRITEKGPFDRDAFREAWCELEELELVTFTPTRFAIPTEKGEKIISILTGIPEPPPRNS